MNFYAIFPWFKAYVCRLFLSLEQQLKHKEKHDLQTFSQIILVELYLTFAPNDEKRTCQSIQEKVRLSCESLLGAAKKCFDTFSGNDFQTSSCEDCIPFTVHNIYGIHIIQFVLTALHGQCL